jgi:hypothetical protein
MHPKDLQEFKQILEDLKQGLDQVEGGFWEKIWSKEHRHLRKIKGVILNLLKIISLQPLDRQPFHQGYLLLKTKLLELMKEDSGFHETWERDISKYINKMDSLEKRLAGTKIQRPSFLRRAATTAGIVTAAAAASVAAEGHMNQAHADKIEQEAIIGQENLYFIIDATNDNNDFFERLIRGGTHGLKNLYLLHENRSGLERIDTKGIPKAYRIEPTTFSGTGNFLSSFGDTSGVGYFPQNENCRVVLMTTINAELDLGDDVKDQIKKELKAKNIKLDIVIHLKAESYSNFSEKQRNEGIARVKKRVEKELNFADEIFYLPVLNKTRYENILGYIIQYHRKTPLD